MSSVNRSNPGRGVNDDMRRAAANLALIIQECGLSQSELSRRSGLSRQLINGWARRRIAVSLSTAVGQLLASIDFGLGDLLLDEEALLERLGKPQRRDGAGAQLFPHLVHASRSVEAARRLDLLAGTYRFRTRLKEEPGFVLERTFQVLAPDGTGAPVRVFSGPVGNRPYAEGRCFHLGLSYFIFVESSEAPHLPFVHAYRDPATPKITSLVGVSIAPNVFGPNQGCPLTRLVYMYRVGPDGAAVSEPGFDAEREFNTFVPVDAPSVLTSY